jgi:hypothetical protein
MSAPKRLVNFRHSITSGNSRANVCHGVDFDVPLTMGDLVQTVERLGILR